MSRILAAKGIFNAIDAVALANEILGIPKIRLVVAGQGEDQARAERYAQERAPGVVEFVGEVRDARKAELLRRSQVLLFPTEYGEGLPNIVLEAMLAGLVIVSRAVGAIPEVVENGSGGFITTSTDPVVFADYLIRLSHDKALVRTIAARNRTLAGDFTTNVVRRRLLATYSRVLADHP